MATRGIDFTRLSLMDALDLAILIEEEAQERYEEFAIQMEQHRTPDAARFFRLMAVNEGRHGSALLDRRTELFGPALRTLSRAGIFDVEAPDFDQVRAFMTPRQAMEAALRSEQKAHAFFTEALPGIQDPDVSALFRELRDEEAEHEALVKAELVKLAPEPSFSDQEFVDPPAAQ